MTDIKMKDNYGKENEIKKEIIEKMKKYAFLKGGRILVSEQLENSS
jgi:hypothetical protein